ncbi:TPA: hypothetical protein UOA81_003698 [Stenotrophomonas maltophilia]|uniref:ABC-three component system middle component 5 n=1 Tax=Stenotrophomonas maltophilia TaxID=40324 RepID=UPI001299A41C|nr:ABC-three component system middle component 5 [Stenotrophomonas maltophilia]HEL5028464.1 hypothetical protein [Stenotrophomonas maltophilia]
MLIYHPAMDAYHCVFRILLILRRLDRIEVDKARILDFYILFPSAILSARLPESLRGRRKFLAAYKNPYRDPISPTTSFHEISRIQEAAINCIAGSGLVEISSLNNGLLVRSQAPLSSDLLQSMDDYLAKNLELAEVILDELSSIPLLGTDGLKHRTSLMEYRYDNV